jgi:hypothetical protein
MKTLLLIPALFQNSFVSLLRKQSVFLIVLLILSQSSFSQLTIDETATAQQLVNTIVQPGFTVSNIKLNCPTGAIATFTGTSDIGFEKGILLTTGKAALAKGPNNVTNSGFNSGAAGDLQLDTLMGTETYDGCAVEFDVIPNHDTLRIRYVFGSEEYPEYVNKQFNDVFSVFVSGPGITGRKNIATVPGTSIPVSINTVNANMNSQYFVPNPNGTSIQYDGFTKPLTAVQHVTANSTYHLKIVIADLTDGIFDSGLFIESGSIGVGIKQNELDAFVQIYPNPANDIIYIQTPFNGNKNITATIYSVLGKLIYQESYADNGQAHQINTGAIETNGIYFIKLQSGNETITRKINIHH